MSVSIYNFKSDILPSNIVFDSSFTLNLNLTVNIPGASPLKNKECKDFAVRLAENKTEIYITDWVIQEVLHRITGIKLKEAFDNIPDNHKKELERKIKDREPKAIDYYKIYPGIMKPICPLLEKTFNLLMDLSYYRKLEESSFEIRRKALSLIKTYMILPADAYIIATAIINKKEANATCDRDFKRVKSEIKIYVPERII